MTPITAAYGDPIRQYPGQVQVQRRVRVKAPGKFFNNLTAAEVKLDYWSVAVEYRERHAFDRHARAWGAAHNGPGIRFIAEGDAIARTPILKASGPCSTRPRSPTRGLVA